ncbi:MAG: hypothetical protein LBB24_02370 [Rickettsiales bacterium]|jgi:hypothetical protein|nr:hypothetical protein [Rickettsiales bacterium]
MSSKKLWKALCVFAVFHLILHSRGAASREKIITITIAPHSDISILSTEESNNNGSAIIKFSNGYSYITSQKTSILKGPKEEEIFDIKVKDEQKPGGIVPHYENIYLYKNGYIYLGMYKHSKASGLTAHILWSNGDEYRGDMKNGEIRGMGTYKNQNGFIYSGNFKYNKPNGNGELVSPDGSTYNGNWVNGAMAGFGTGRFDTNDTYIGYWNNNKMNGQGDMKFSDGNIFSGIWKDGKINGEGEFYKKSNDTWYNVIFSNGQIVYFSGEKSGNKGRHSKSGSQGSKQNFENKSKDAVVHRTVSFGHLVNLFSGIANNILENDGREKYRLGTSRDKYRFGDYSVNTIDTTFSYSALRGDRYSLKLIADVFNIEIADGTGKKFDTSGAGLGVYFRDNLVGNLNVVAIYRFSDMLSKEKGKKKTNNYNPYRSTIESRNGDLEHYSNSHGLLVGFNYKFNFISGRLRLKPGLYVGHVHHSIMGYSDLSKNENCLFLSIGLDSSLSITQGLNTNLAFRHNIALKNYSDQSNAKLDNLEFRFGLAGNDLDKQNWNTSTLGLALRYRIFKDNVSEKGSGVPRELDLAISYGWL